MTPHIGFTGTQSGGTPVQMMTVYRLVLELEATDASHGDCIGADDQFDQIAMELGLRKHIRPSTLIGKRAHCLVRDGDVLHDPKPPLERNHDIVDSVCAMIAAPKEMTETLRSGTSATVRYARKQRKPSYIVWPDGTVSEERT